MCLKNSEIKKKKIIKIHKKPQKLKKSSPPVGIKPLPPAHDIASSIFRISGENFELAIGLINVPRENSN